MKCSRFLFPVVAAVVALTTAAVVNAQLTPKSFDPPVRTSWTPEGCRAVPSDDPAFLSRRGWRNIHADAINTDEISSALTPVFAADWIAEPDQYHTTGPSFDSEGNLYAAPFYPYEPVVMISLEPENGERRWAIPNTTGAPPGTSVPMILRDPDDPGAEIVYLALYDRAIAVRTDGTMVWDVATGLTQSGVFRDLSLGTNYLPSADAIMGITADGFLYALDRATGASLLDAPYELPGERSPPSSGTLLPGSDAVFRTLVNLPADSDLSDFVDLLLGDDNEVANQFSVDPDTGRIFLAATAPDEADGTIDGVSELGAIYGLDLVPNGAGYEIIEACSRFFDGGSASTPSLSPGGARLYVGDNFGKLIALNPDCSDAWELDLGTQIFGSIAVSSDNGEIYASSAGGIFQVIDEGDQGTLRWSASLDVFEIPPPLQAAGFVNFNLNLVSIGANGLFVQAGAGPPGLPLTVGIAQLDRDTGEVRWFAEGLEETVAVMSTGPDGAIYVGNSPVRRIFSFVASQAGQLPPIPPVTGGIRKWAPQRLDLLARDAVCAASDRAANADKYRHECRDSAKADVTQILELIEQADDAAKQARLDGDLSRRDSKILRFKLSASRFVLKLFSVHGLGAAHKVLEAGCVRVDD